MKFIKSKAFWNMTVP